MADRSDVPLSSSTPLPLPAKRAPLRLAVRGNAKLALEIMHEDADLFVVEKPAGMVTQPGKGHTTDSLLNALFALKEGSVGKQLHNLGVRRDYGLLHRLDKDTSGLLVVAKSPNAYDQLRRDFEARKVDKEYLTVVEGIPRPAQGVVQARLKEMEVPNPEAHGRGTIKKVVISRQGEEAISAYKVLSHVEAEDGKAANSLVKVTIKTGRLHQIRAHMMFLNCRVLGDDLYVPAEIAGGGGKEQVKPPRLCLHAFHLGFKHPVTNKWVHFYSPLPTDLTRFAEKLGLTVPPAPCHPQ
jgi:23S rRNA pseudouridine1911/1915/1917 synthase